MTIQKNLRKICSEYKLSPLDAEILLSLAIKRSKEYILAHPEKKLTRLQEKKFIVFAERRFAGEPIAYIAGEKEFFGLDFLVDKNVLIPRPETELLVEKTIEKINSFFCHPALDTGSSSKSQFKTFLDPRWSLSSCNGDGDDNMAVIDVGTGSGNIIISIAKNIPSKIKNKINLYAVDISKKSLQIAKANAKRYKLNKKIKFIQSDLLEYFQPMTENFKNILIIANLPYVSPELYKKNKNNLKHEPKQALCSPKKGLAHYEKLIKQASLLFIDHYSLILEFSPEQKPEISRIIKEYLPKAQTKFFKDLAGKWRVVEIEF